MSCHISCHVICHVICHGIRHVICHVISYVISYHIMSYVMSCVVSYKTHMLKRYFTPICYNYMVSYRIVSYSIKHRKFKTYQYFQRFIFNITFVTHRSKTLRDRIRMGAICGDSKTVGAGRGWRPKYSQTKSDGLRSENGCKISFP